jgi:TM2 domain-containing membrane protein YozV
MDRKKSSLLSAFLSIVPGLGQIYVGALSRGAAILLTVTVTALLVRWQGSNFLFIGIILVWLWNVWDTYNLAQERRVSLVPPFLIIGV